VSDRPPLSDLPPPTGTVAFLFTDIEGSTQLWEEQPQAMAMALRRHDDLVRTAVLARGGHVFSTGGDGFAVAFPTVADALQAAIDVQRSLLGDDAFEAEFKVRMGLHAGAAVERDGDYFGPVVNRAARIMAAAHGGQILVSAAAVGILGPVGPDLELRELGAHQLKDLLTPEQIVQASAAGLPRDFPPLRSRRAGNIPRSRPVAVGRDRELHAIVEALSRGRLVTVVSPVARSAVNLSFAVVRSVDERFPFGAWHLDLATLGGRAELVPALATMLGVTVDSPGEAASVLGELARALEGRPALLVLEDGTLGDELAPAVADLLERLPSVSILVTSPEPLELPGEQTVEVRQPALPPDLQRFRASPILERDAELARLRQELALAAGGARRLVLVSGEEGIGKSRLVAEVAADVLADDGLVLRGGWDEEGVTDFQAFREAFTRHLEGADQTGARVPLGELLPDLDALVPDSTADRPGGDDADRYRLLDALDSWLAQIASAQPVLLWLDDLQWADPSSLLMVQHLARSPRAAALAIVLTYQPAAMSRVDDLTRTLAQLRRSPGFEQIELSGLGTQSTRSLISRASTRNLAPRSLALLHEWSGGNPYFLHELVRLVDESAPLDGGPGERWVADLEELGAPDSIADVVRWRLARRSPRLARLLSVAAIVGTEFDAATLAAVLDADVEEVEDLLDDAAASGFIEEVPDTGAAYSFRLDLVRQALYQELPPRQRIRLHRRVLDNLLAGVDPDPAAVTRHLSIAAGPDDLDRTVEFATAAAHRATEQMAFENAARHYDQALHVLERHPEPDGPRIELLIAAGEAHNRAGGLGTGRRLLHAAAEEARRRDRSDLLARAGLALGGVLPSAPPTDADAVELLRDIADRFPGDTPERARALVRQAEWLHRAATYDERRALVDEAVGIAQRLGDPSVLGWVLNSSVLAMLGPDDAEAMPAAAEQIILLSHDTNDDELAFSGWKLLLQGLFACGRMDEIRDVIATVRRLGKHLRQPEYLRIAVMWDATVATIEGRFGNARQQASEALTITQAGDHSQVTEIQLMLQIPAFGLRGTSAALRSALDDIGRNGEDGVSSARAWFHAEAGELDEAHELLRTPRLVERMAERRWYLFWGEAVGYGTTAALLGDVEQARQIRDLIAPYREHSAVLGVAAFLGAVPHHCGVLNGVLGEWDDAVADLEVGLERHRAMSARPWVALSQIELARVLVARDGPGDAARAAKLAAEATATADELGLGAVRTRAGQAGSGFDASRWASTDG